MVDLYIIGMETLLGLVCFGLFLYQTIALLEIYSSRDTFRTSKEVEWTKPMPSPLVIICQEPGSLNISDDNIKVAANTWSNFTLDRIVTAFKVIRVNKNCYTYFVV